VELVATIDRLINQEGFTLKGARQTVERGGSVPAAASVPVPAAMSIPAQAPGEGRMAGSNLPPDFLPRLRAIRDRLASAL
jgi:hypothetical protein